MRQPHGRGAIAGRQHRFKL